MVPLLMPSLRMLERLDGHTCGKTKESLQPSVAHAADRLRFSVAAYSNRVAWIDSMSFQKAKDAPHSSSALVTRSTSPASHPLLEPRDVSDAGGHDAVLAAVVDGRAARGAQLCAQHALHRNHV